MTASELATKVVISIVILLLGGCAIWFVWTFESDDVPEVPLHVLMPEPSTFDASELRIQGNEPSVSDILAQGAAGDICEIFGHPWAEKYLDDGNGTYGFDWYRSCQICKRRQKRVAVWVATENELAFWAAVQTVGLEMCGEE